MFEKLSGSIKYGSNFFWSTKTYMIFIALRFTLAHAVRGGGEGGDDFVDSYYLLMCNGASLT